VDFIAFNEAACAIPHDNSIGPTVAEDIASYDRVAAGSNEEARICIFEDVVAFDPPTTIVHNGDSIASAIPDRVVQYGGIA
jgi:hypothetical protein